MNYQIRPKVFIVAFSLLGPVLLASHLITSPVMASSSNHSQCDEAKSVIQRTQLWMNLYQPLAARGGVYRKAYTENQSRNRTARTTLANCSN